MSFTASSNSMSVLTRPLQGVLGFRVDVDGFVHVFHFIHFTVS